MSTSITPLGFLELYLVVIFICFRYLEFVANNCIGAYRPAQEMTRELSHRICMTIACILIISLHAMVMRRDGRAPAYSYRFFFFDIFYILFFLISAIGRIKTLIARMRSKSAV